MKNKVTTYVLAYGVVLAGLGLLTHWLAPEIAKPTLITGAVAGALCALWGVLGLLGHRWRAWTGLTLVLTTLVLIPQTVTSWMRPGDAESISHAPSLLMTTMLLASVGLLMWVFHFDDGKNDASSP